MILQRTKFFIISLLLFFMLSVSAQTVTKGQLWTAKKIDNTYVLSVNDKASLVDALMDFVKQNNIKAGSITGIGAINKATLRCYNPDTQQYIDSTFKEQMEISNLTGNISTKDGAPYLHLHITLGDAHYHAFAGHLLNADIRGAGEFTVIPLNGTVERTYSSEVGLNFYDFGKE